MTHCRLSVGLRHRRRNPGGPIAGYDQEARAAPLPEAERLLAPRPPAVYRVGVAIRSEPNEGWDVYDGLLALERMERGVRIPRLPPTPHPTRGHPMSKQFAIPMTGDPAALLARAKAAAAQGGIALEGDTEAGTFAGSGVEGAYRRDGTTMHVTIDKKPFFAPWSMVESRLRGFFGA